LFTNVITISALTKFVISSSHWVDSVSVQLREPSPGANVNSIIYVNRDNRRWGWDSFFLPTS
jgi:hypothetical protein